MYRLARPLILLVILIIPLAAGACQQQRTCVDFAPNATVTDVHHDEQAGWLHVFLHHELGYCTGTGEKPYSVEHIEIDLESREMTVDQRESDVLPDRPLPGTCCALYQDGAFSSEGCPGCELRLESRDGAYTFVFTNVSAAEGMVMRLRIFEGDAPLKAASIGGYRTTPPQCSLISCDDMATVRLAGLEIDQVYEVTVETADQRRDCTIRTTDELRITCDGNTFYGSLADDARIQLDGTPERVAVTVRQGDTVLAEHELTPTYEEVAPNGPFCTPVCQQAELVIEL